MNMNWRGLMFSRVFESGLDFWGKSAANTGDARPRRCDAAHGCCCCTWSNWLRGFATLVVSPFQHVYRISNLKGINFGCVSPLKLCTFCCLTHLCCSPCCIFLPLPPEGGPPGVFKENAPLDQGSGGVFSGQKMNIFKSWQK